MVRIIGHRCNLGQVIDHLAHVQSCLAQMTLFQPVKQFPFCNTLVHPFGIAAGWMNANGMAAIKKVPSQETSCVWLPRRQDGIGLCQFLVDQSVKVRDVDKVERHENPVVVIDEVTLATGYVIMGRAGPALPLPLAKAVP